jgi:hypothetical protein
VRPTLRRGDTAPTRGPGSPHGLGARGARAPDACARSSPGPPFAREDFTNHALRAGCRWTKSMSMFGEPVCVDASRDGEGLASVRS